MTPSQLGRRSVGSGFVMAASQLGRKSVGSRFRPPGLTHVLIVAYDYPQDRRLISLTEYILLQ
jgi:hypothetical protein